VSPAPRSRGSRGDLSDDLAALARLAADVGPSLVPVGHRELLHSITETARRLFDAGACSIALLNETEDELQFVMASGAGEEAVRDMRIPANQGVAGWVVMSGQPIAIEDVTTDPRFASNVAESTGYVPKSILAMPLQTERRVLGVIELLDRRADSAHAGRDMELLGVFAGQAALAIESATIFRDLGRALLEALASAAGGDDLGAQLLEHAKRAPKPRSDLAEISALFQELARAGEPERALAVRVLRDVLAYVRDRDIE